MAATVDERLLVQVASYNSNLQGHLSLPQDLVDWLSPTLASSRFVTAETSADIVAVGFQELLPLHLGLTGLSNSVLASRDALIREQIEKLSGARKSSYSLVAKIVNVGVALLVYARDDGVARRVCDVQTAWTGCGPMWMGNKGAVGIRFRVSPKGGGVGGDFGETFTFVTAHLTAASQRSNFKGRVLDYKHIVRNLLFPSPKGWTTLYATSHLFFLGDLNFRLDTPGEPLPHDVFAVKLRTPEGREELAQWDELSREMKEGSSGLCYGLREGPFWEFPCSYKYVPGTVDTLSLKRRPAWTDRILYTTYTDDPSNPTQSSIIPLLYTSIQSYTTSDHKPITALLLLPQSKSNLTSLLPQHSTGTIGPYLAPPPAELQFVPSKTHLITRSTGKLLDWILGWIWYVFQFIGAGNTGFGLGNFVLGLGVGAWWKGYFQRSS